MDRNSIPMKSLFVLIQSLSARRAWIEISFGLYSPLLSRLSLSARRAWIEINRFQGFGGSTNVALRKESVDRNNYIHSLTPYQSASLSARRAWIEIWAARIRLRYPGSRSPQGERG